MVLACGSWIFPSCICNAFELPFALTWCSLLSHLLWLDKTGKQVYLQHLYRFLIVDAGGILDTHVRFTDDLSNICTEVVGGALNAQGNMTDRGMFSSNFHGWSQQIAFVHSDHSAMSVTQQKLWSMFCNGVSSGISICIWDSICQRKQCVYAQPIRQHSVHQCLLLMQFKFSSAPFEVDTLKHWLWQIFCMPFAATQTHHDQASLPTAPAPLSCAFRFHACLASS